MKTIQFSGEFGHELVGVIPYAYWCYKNNEKIATVSGVDTDCFYYFSTQHNSSAGKRACSHAQGFDNERSWNKELNESRWIPPEYKKHFKNNEFVFDKPLCIISNKYNKEWNNPPVNFIDITTLDEMFKMLKHKYQLVYNRVYSKAILNDGDTVAYKLYDFEFIQENHKDVIVLTDVPCNSYNTLQCKIMANCDCHISVQGGNSVLASYFGGTNIIYGVIGGEVRNNCYENWYHKLSGANIIHCDSYESLLGHVETRYV